MSHLKCFSGTLPGLQAIGIHSPFLNMCSHSWLFQLTKHEELKAPSFWVQNPPRTLWCSLCSSKPQHKSSSSLSHLAGRNLRLVATQRTTWMTLWRQRARERCPYSPHRQLQPFNVRLWPHKRYQARAHQHSPCKILHPKTWEEIIKLMF